MVFQTTGTANLSGGWAIKLRGMQVTIDSAEGHQEFSTTEESSSPLIITRHWIVIESDDLAGTIETASNPLRAAIDSGSIHWNGPGFVQVASGHLANADESYRVEPGMTALEGVLQADVVAGGTEANPLMLMSLSGDLKKTTLATSPLASPGIKSGFSWLPPFLVGAVLASAVAGGIAYGVRRKPHALPAAAKKANTAAPEIDDEAYLSRYAAFAEGHGDTQTALACVRALRKLDDNAMLAMWQTELHDALGEEEAAMGALEEACQLASPEEAEPYFELAMRQARRGQHKGALQSIQIAFEREPLLAHEVDADKTSATDPFQSLRGDEMFRRILKRAVARASARSGTPL
jgi:hypothetical protein